MRLLWSLMLCAAAVAADKRDCLDYSLPSKDAINASLLFDEAHRYIGEGRYGTARVALEALAAVYPESCLARYCASSYHVVAACPTASLIDC